VNAGRIRNQGFEILVSALAVRDRNVELDFTANIATNSNRVLDLGGVDQGSGFIQVGMPGANRHVPGHPVGAWFQQKVVSATLVGTGRTAIVTDVLCDGGDANGILLPDGTPTELGGAAVNCADAPYLDLGNPIPTFEGSFATTLTLFRNFKLYALVDWQTGHTKAQFSLRARCGFANTCRENYFPEEYDPAVIADIRLPKTVPSSILVGADFAKIREVSLTWTAPQKIASRVAAKRAHITIAGRNLHTFTGYAGLDPEAGYMAVLGVPWVNMENAQLPQLTSFVTTVSVTF
jgi:hypothetical protein